MTSTTAEPTPRPDKIVIAKGVWLLRPAVPGAARVGGGGRKGGWSKPRCLVCGCVVMHGEWVYAPRYDHPANPWRHARFHATCVDFIDHRPHHSAKIQMMPA